MYASGVPEPRYEVSEGGEVMNGVELITAERQRQIDAEGWTPEHDDEHKNAEILSAAVCYSQIARGIEYGHRLGDVANAVYPSWPWDLEWLKPSPDPIRNLVKAGALICAEIDRLQRKAAL